MRVHAPPPFSFLNPKDRIMPIKTQTAPAGLVAHRFAEIFPPMTPKDYAAFKATIKEHGVKTAIVLYEGTILDGLHRYKAAGELGIPCPCETFTGTDDDALDIVVVFNIDGRRHLNTSQRALIAAEIATMKRGAPQGSQNRIGGKKAATLNPPIGGIKDTRKSTADAASQMNVSPRQVDRAKALKREAPKPLIEEVRAGKKTVGGALKEVQAKKHASRTISAAQKAVNDRAHDLRTSLSRPFGLKRSEVDPDFQGSNMDFVAKYGHVNLHTKTELERRAAEMRGDALVVWLKDAVQGKMPEASVDDLVTWINATGKPDFRQKKFEERIAAIAALHDRLAAMLADVRAKLTAPQASPPAGAGEGQAIH